MADTFIKHVLGYGNKKRDGYYGKTAGYYGTVEQQGRLTLHMHMMVWIKHSISPQQIRDEIMNSDSDFQRRIVRYLEAAHVGEFKHGTITEVQDKQSQRKTIDPQYVAPTLKLPELPVEYCNMNCNQCEECERADHWWINYEETVDEIAVLSNVHVCHPGCTNKSHPTCKSRFPRDVFPQTLVDPDTGCLSLKKGEAWVNCFTPVVTYLLRCNTDVTSLLSGTAIKAVIAYVTDYITKTPLKTHVIFDAVKTVFTR
ncbi:hypothetical protein BDW22DRAFT_1340573, partial [Trametopsis cervina]